MSCWIRWSGLSMRSLEEPRAVVRLVGQPVADETFGQPNPPPHNEPLCEVDVEQHLADVERDQHEKHDDREPEPPNAGIAHRVVAGPRALERHLQSRVLVVVVIGQQHAQAHRHHHRHQQQPKQSPRLDALTALEVVAGDLPELSAPDGVTGDQNQHEHQRHGGEQPSSGDPQQRVDDLVAPVQRRRERLHCAAS